MMIRMITQEVTEKAHEDIDGDDQDHLIDLDLVIDVHGHVIAIETVTDIGAEGIICYS